MVKGRARGGIQGKIGTHPPGSEIHFVQNGGAILLQQKIEFRCVNGAAQVGRQSAAVLRGSSEPQAVHRLIAHARTNGISLILRNWELARVRYSGGFAAKKQSACNRSLSCPCLVRVA